MKTQILQGINLENKITTIKIELDDTQNKSEIKTIIEKIQNFHPLFLKTYTLEQNKITMQSKLPKLWREIAKIFNQLAINKITKEIAEDFILNTIIKKQVLSMSTIPTLYAAQNLNYEITQFYTNGEIVTQNSSFNRHYCIGSGKRSHIVVSFAGTGDSHIAQKTQKDKWTTNTIIERLGLPIAKWQIFSDKEELAKIFDNYKKPFVIKPVGLVGGHGVTTDIKTIQEAYKAVDIAQGSIDKKDRPDWQTKMMIQEQVFGEDYRILVIGGKFRIATKRIPAFIIGDGVLNIEQLITETNKDPRRDVSNPTHTLKPIKIDEVLIDYLKEQGKTLSTIPAKNERIQVRKPASMSLGGITEDFTDKVHPQIKYICETLASSIHAYTLGVDVICKDISQPLTSDNGSIIEMNTMPEGYLNTFPVVGKQYTEMNEIFVKGLLAPLPEVKHVVIAPNEIISKEFIVESEVEEAEVDLQNSQNDNLSQKLTDLMKNKYGEEKRIGLYINGKYFIDGILIKSNLATESAREALKLNATLDVIVFAYSDSKEVSENGFGFDKVDLWIGI